MGRVDFRKKEKRLTVREELLPGEWVRSPLWDQDHTIGVAPEFLEEGLAWCGRALYIALEWDDENLGGLWESTRKGNKCTICNNKIKELNEWH